MKVQELLIEDHFGIQKRRYMLIDKTGQPIIPVVKYLKYLDNTGKAENTLKSYCYHLMCYFKFLEQKEKNYQEVNLDLLAEFMGWLRNPYQSTKVIPYEKTLSKRSERTVNIIITCVIGFYDYLTRLEDYEKDLSEKVKKQISGRFQTFKPFLHHITNGKPVDKNILKIREPRRNIMTLSREQIHAIYHSCNNIRDELLIRILYEGGLRVSEALSLWIEDFDIGKNCIKVRRSKTSSGENRKVYLSEDTMNLFQDYLLDYHSDEIDTNFVFITLRGDNKGTPLNDESVRSLVRRIKKKTGINFTPHMLRHTFATELHQNGVDIAVIQKLLGHAQVQTTIQIYVHPSDEAIRKSWEQAQTNKS